MADINSPLSFGSFSLENLSSLYPRDIAISTPEIIKATPLLISFPNGGHSEGSTVMHFFSTG